MINNVIHQLYSLSIYGKSSEMVLKYLNLFDKLYEYSEK